VPRDCVEPEILLDFPVSLKQVSLILDLITRMLLGNGILYLMMTLPNP
jgi:hypothetical protein